MDLNKWQEELEDDLKKQTERENLYNTQSEEIAVGLANNRKVDDGYYMWSSKIQDSECFIVSARKMLIFKDGYRPMTAKFKINKEFTFVENLQEVIKMMLKKQNGEYVADEINESQEV